jgi:hypothetical protein
VKPNDSGALVRRLSDKFSSSSVSQQKQQECRLPCAWANAGARYARNLPPLADPHPRLSHWCFDFLAFHSRHKLLGPLPRANWLSHRSRLATAQKRVASAKAQCAAISKAIPSIRGSAKLLVSVRELNAKLASMARELAAVAKSVGMISRIP